MKTTWLFCTAPKKTLKKSCHVPLFYLDSTSKLWGLPTFPTGSPPQSWRWSEGVGSAPLATAGGCCSCCPLRWWPPRADLLRWTVMGKLRENHGKTMGKWGSNKLVSPWIILAFLGNPPFLDKHHRQKWDNPPFPIHLQPWNSKHHRQKPVTLPAAWLAWPPSPPWPRLRWWTSVSLPLPTGATVASVQAVFGNETNRLMKREHWRESDVFWTIAIKAIQVDFPLSQFWGSWGSIINPWTENNLCWTR